MKLDICLQADIFNIFRNIIWNKFEVDCSKYITSCFLSLDLMLKFNYLKILLCLITLIRVYKEDYA